MPKPLTPEELAELRQVASDAMLVVDTSAAEIVLRVERFWEVFSPSLALRLLRELDQRDRLLEEIRREQVEGQPPLAS